MLFKKSQTSTEYLIILAVVVVIALIVVGILGGIPSIGGGVSEGSARAQLKTLPLGIENYASDSLNTRLIIQNNMPSSVRLTAMTIDGKKCSLMQTTFRAGERRQVDCFGVRSLHTNRFLYSIDLTYTDLQTGASYTISPDVPLVGTGLGGARLHTGQQTCYEGAFGGVGPISCTSVHAGQDGFADRTPKDFREVSSGVVLDRHTGLYWSNASSGTGNRQSAFDYCSDLNSESRGGFTDWRVPNIVELIVVLGSSTTVDGNPSPDGNFWPGDLRIWSLTQTGSRSFQVSLLEGGTPAGEGNQGRFLIPSTNIDSYAVCVRGKTTGINLVDGFASYSKNFIDFDDGTIIDLDMGIIWFKGFSDMVYWDDAVDFCTSLKDGVQGLADGSNQGDWRLPSVSEAVTLIDYSCYSTSSRCFGTHMNAAFSYPDMSDPTNWVNYYYWTGTTTSSESNGAYALIFGPSSESGLIDVGFKDFDDFLRARCVRDL